jgi:hypothetical protein
MLQLHEPLGSTVHLRCVGKASTGEGRPTGRAAGVSSVTEDGRVTKIGPVGRHCNNPYIRSRALLCVFANLEWGFCELNRIRSRLNVIHTTGPAQLCSAVQILRAGSPNTRNTDLVSEISIEVPAFLHRGIFAFSLYIANSRDCRFVPPCNCAVSPYFALHIHSVRAAKTSLRTAFHAAELPTHLSSLVAATFEQSCNRSCCWPEVLSVIFRAHGDSIKVWWASLLNDVPLRVFTLFAVSRAGRAGITASRAMRWHL